MPQNEATGLDWLRRMGNPAEAITDRWGRDGVVFSVNAIAKLAEAFGFIVATAEYRPEPAAGLIASLERSMDHLVLLFNRDPVPHGDPVSSHQCYVRHGEREHYVSRTPRRVIGVYSDSAVFSLGWGVFVFDADYAADPDAVMVHEATIHAWKYRGCHGRPHYQYRFVVNGGLIFHAPLVENEEGRFVPTLKFEEGDDTQRWGLHT